MTNLNEWLKPNESVLWQHIVESPREAEAQPENKVVYIVGHIFMAVMYGISGVFFYQSLKDGIETQTLLYGVVSFVVASSIGWFSRTRYGQKLKADLDHTPFQNGFITSQRVVFFNHFNSMQSEFFASDIKEAKVDFENGGRALRVIPSERRKSAVLVGTSDFQQAVSLINSRLIQRTTS